MLLGGSSGEEVGVGTIDRWATHSGNTVAVTRAIRDLPSGYILRSTTSVCKYVCCRWRSERFFSGGEILSSVSPTREVYCEYSKGVTHVRQGCQACQSICFHFHLMKGRGPRLCARRKYFTFLVLIWWTKVFKDWPPKSPLPSLNLTNMQYTCSHLQLS